MTTNNQQIEHFCTLFDSNFLPMGMTLHQSLMVHAQPFHLWIICMDELVEKQLTILALPHVTLLPLRELETPELLAIKPGRNRAEYCWTITPFTFSSVFKSQPDIEQVTYLDADLFFFDNPQILLQELADNNKQVLITEHAYAPEYEQTNIHGRFCVQFLTFKNTPDSLKVMKWWQDRCLEWCFAREEDGKFGDQKYLDSWTSLFPNEIWIVQQTEKTLAPWNVRFFSGKFKANLNPVFYHFHNFRIVKPNRAILYYDYIIGKNGIKMYQEYLRNLQNNLSVMNSYDFPIPCLPFSPKGWSMMRAIKYTIRKKIRFAPLSF